MRILGAHFFSKFLVGKTKIIKQKLLTATIEIF